MKLLSGLYPRLRAQGVQVLGLSADDSATQGRFALHCATPFPLLSDPGARIADLYRARWFGFLPVADRITFVLDGERRIRHVLQGMPDPGGLMDAVASVVQPAAAATPSLRPTPVSTPARQDGR